MSAPSLSQIWGQCLLPLREAVQAGQGRHGLVGLHGSSAAFALAVLTGANIGYTREPTPRPWLIVTATNEAAERLYDDLEFFYTLLGISSDVLALFPEWETLPYEAAPPHVGLIARRMRTLHRLTEGVRTVLVTSIPALLQFLLPRDVFAHACLKLFPGEALEREVLVAHLLRLGYCRASVVEIPGEFNVRGGIVDIFSTAYADPLRVELLGDTVESVRTFDPATQQSTTKLAEAWLLPAREWVHPTGSPSQEVIGPSSLPPDAEWRAPEIYSTMHTLLDYFKASPVLVLDQPEALAQKAAEFKQEVREAYTRRGYQPGVAPYPSPDRLYISWEEILARTGTWPVLALAPFASLDPSWQLLSGFPAQSPFSIGLAQRGMPFSDTLAILDRLRDKGPVLLVARSRGQVDRLLSLLGEHDLPATSWTSQVWSMSFSRKPPFYVLQGSLSSGLLAGDGQLSLITEEELFAKGLWHRPAAKTKAATFLSSLDDLNVGDFVVHVQHGIARYEGLRRLEVQEFESDYLILAFAGGDKLYVPLDRMNQVQRYRGADGHAPRLDRLGGTSWARTTARVKKDIEAMAQELVQLYARRELAKRAEYGPGSTLTHEFEAAFEFEETPDQLRAIEDVCRDMEASKPMDRLVCGDVGYGKTEVAMRAAFKAVEDNRQVVVLAPTTLLAQQHYENFSQRFAPFPARVAMLSRFQPPREVKILLRDLAFGTVDVVIGTHRLLQEDVQFRNLGLVIIDEEQWFGVRHKERLKQLRTQVDVLTLTATPIPRTFQMAMSGVRDLSVIETPPAGRLAIRTHVLRYSDTVIREAIIRELARGGQVFFVHNCIQTIEHVAAHLRQLVPEARVAMAHGRMDERLLEAVMLKFLRGEADVLLSTSIIQSGLDIPNANTILVNRADTFGLAQLYQLRGRVGRAGLQAYAYFFVPDEGTLSGDAQKRLVAIQEFAEMGSGFRIAAADLEIRGAGNLLGKQQSGHIAAIGLDLYLQMVERAMLQFKGNLVEEEVEPTLHLNVSAFIPEDYVPDVHQRLSLYKRLTSVHQVGDLAFLHGEIQDRYGTTPDPVERLLEVMQIRLLAKSLWLASVEVRQGVAVITFDPKARLPEAGIQRLIDQYKARFRLLSPLSFEIQLSHAEWAAMAPEITAALQILMGRGRKGASENSFP